MASSTLTKHSSPRLQTLRKEARKEIMNTDVSCEVLFPEGQEGQSAVLLEEAFAMMRAFADRYSRFQEGNDLYRFNQSVRFHLSPEFFDILAQAQRFHTFTGGLFDPSILPALDQEGYVGAPHPSRETEEVAEKSRFSALRLDPATLTASKPRDLLIDLGGIGKGYIVDRVAEFLSLHFADFLIDAGGDISARGTNKKEDYPYWAIEMEHPGRPEEPAALLLLSDLSVATSGRNRRRWQKDGREKHHLIDPRTGKSASLHYQSVTVIAESTVRADILAKALFIAGKEQAPRLAAEWQVPAIFIDHADNVTITPQAQPYVWKAS